MTAYDAIVIGLGAMGSSAAMHLALRGQRVLGLEQSIAADGGVHAHDRGSSHGWSRIIRMCYYEHPDYVPLLRRAYELWRELEARNGGKPGTLMQQTGGLYIGPPGCEAIQGSYRAAVEHGLEHQMLERALLARRYPQFRAPGDFVGLYEPMAGILRPEAVIEAQLREALKSGADLRAGHRVVEWTAEGEGASVVADTPRGRSEFRARRLIFACGAWATRVVGDLGVRVTATRQVLGWVRPRVEAAAAFAQPDMPVWAIDAAHLGEGLYYGFPVPQSLAPGEPAGFKLARHAPGGAIDPDRNQWEPQPGDEDTFRPCLKRWIPEADGPTETIRICMYENSPDQHFIIDRHPSNPNVLIACGFSGHGFKFASVVGEILADLAIEGTTRHPIGFLSLARFGKGATA